MIFAHQLFDTFTTINDNEQAADIKINLCSSPSEGVSYEGREWAAVFA